MSSEVPAPPTGSDAPLSWEEATPPASVPQESQEEPTNDTTPKKTKTKSSMVRVGGRMAMLLRGELTVADLDDEELARGQLRGDDGNFHGRKTNLVPRAMHDEMVRRILDRGKEKMREDFFGAIDVIATVMNDSTVDANVRLKAADMIITRIAGKPADKVDVAIAVKPWEGTLKGIMRAIPEDTVIDVAVVEDEEES